MENKETAKRRWVFVAVGILIAAAIPQFAVENALFARVLSVAAVCLILWLSEATPPFVPSLLLWALIPLALGPLDAKLNFARVMTWAADPVLALFFGGFALGVAAEKFGVDREMIRYAFRVSEASFYRLLLLVILITAFLSMWLSNIAAAALMIACLRPAFNGLADGDLLRRTLLIGVALGADLGGMATPIGTGPNAVAIASLAGSVHVSFIGWMAFAFPLTAGMLLLGFGLLWLRTRGRVAREATAGFDLGSLEPAATADGERTKGRRIFLTVMAVTAALWLTEPLHGIASAVVAVAASAALFLTGLLSRESLRKIDWSTLLLIAGGITLGKLFEATGIVAAATEAIPFGSYSPTAALFIVCLSAAFFASIMSNTASVIMLIPIATALIPGPSTAILVAISASFGIPFNISTPPNAMAYGEGGLSSGDLFWPGIVIMIVGCVLVSTTGPTVLRIVGIG